MQVPALISFRPVSTVTSALINLHPISFECTFAAFLLSRAARMISYPSFTALRSSASFRFCPRVIVLFCLRVSSFTSTTIPLTPEGTRNETSFTSPAFSPKMARKSFSSGESSVSDFGATFPTSMLLVPTSAPMRTIPSSSRFFNASSETLGISHVTSSFPRRVSLASSSNL